jgi:hypothetical protein
MCEEEDEEETESPIFSFTLVLYAHLLPCLVFTACKEPLLKGKA